LNSYPEASQKFLQETVIPYPKENDIWERGLQQEAEMGAFFFYYEMYFVLPMKL